MAIAEAGHVRRHHTLLILSFAAAGCVGDLVEIGGNNGADLSTGGGSPDLAGMNGGGGDGGSTQSVHFSPDIETDIENLGCTASVCHGGSQIPVLKNGAAMMNYTNFKADAMTGENSPVLTKNLQGSGVTHGGGSKFQSTSDPVYVRWLAWINAGNPQ